MNLFNSYGNDCQMFSSQDYSRHDDPESPYGRKGKSLIGQIASCSLHNPQLPGGRRLRVMLPLEVCLSKLWQLWTLNLLVFKGNYLGMGEFKDMAMFLFLQWVLMSPIATIL